MTFHATEHFTFFPSVIVSSVGDEKCLFTALKHRKTQKTQEKKEKKHSLSNSVNPFIKFALISSVYLIFVFYLLFGFVSKNHSNDKFWLSLQCNFIIVVRKTKYNKINMKLLKLSKAIWNLLLFLCNRNLI